MCSYRNRWFQKAELSFSCMMLHLFNWYHRNESRSCEDLPHGNYMWTNYSLPRHQEAAWGTVNCPLAFDQVNPIPQKYSSRRNMCGPSDP